jgi:hypothetical protein
MPTCVHGPGACAIAGAAQVAASTTSSARTFMTSPDFIRIEFEFVVQ